MKGTPEHEHARLLCPVMSRLMAAELNGTPHCATRACAMWVWSDKGTELSAWMSKEAGEALIKMGEGWTHLWNNEAGQHQYQRPYSGGHRPGQCGLRRDG
jgi:hypothetical protein